MTVRGSVAVENVEKVGRNDSVMTLSRAFSVYHMSIPSSIGL